MTPSSRSQGSLGGLYIKDYKSPCAAAMICCTPVNIQTHRQHFHQLVWKADDWS